MTKHVTSTIDNINSSLLTQHQRYIWLLRPDLQREAAFPNTTATHTFLYWCFRHGKTEYPKFEDDPTATQYSFMTSAAFAGSSHAPPISHYLAHFWHDRSDLREVYTLNTDRGRRSFAEWLVLFGRPEQAIADLWIDRSLREWLLAADNAYSPIPRIALALWQGSRELQEAYDLARAAHRQRFARWFSARGVIDTGLTWIAESCDVSPVDSHVIGVFRDSERHLPRTGKKGVNLIGFANAEFGLGEDVRHAARALTLAGIEVSIFSVDPSPSVRQNERVANNLLSETLPFDISLFCMTAFDCANLYVKEGPKLFSDRYNIGYWAWELPRWPIEWVSAFDLVSELWASSRHTQASMKTAAPVEVLHMPMAVDLPTGNSAPRSFFGLPERAFLFLYIFDWNSWIARKNPFGVIEAFSLAFPKGIEPVGLVLKIISVNTADAAWAALQAHARADSRIIIISGTSDRTTLAALYQCCDAYVSLHRAEGFGRTIAEAMLMGKPVVATNWSGNLDFTDRDNSCVVDYDLRPISADEYPFSAGQAWAEPDLYSAATWLSRLAGDPDWAVAKGIAGRNSVLDQFDHAAVGARYAARLDTLLGSRNAGVISLNAGRTSTRNRFRNAENARTGRVENDTRRTAAQHTAPATKASDLTWPVPIKSNQLVGFVDKADHTSIEGWVWNPSRPGERVQLFVFDGEKCIASVIAKEYRPDLSNARIGDGFYAFRVPLSKATLSRGYMHLRLNCAHPDSNDLGTFTIRPQPSVTDDARAAFVGEQAHVAVSSEETARPSAQIISEVLNTHLPLELLGGSQPLIDRMLDDKELGEDECSFELHQLGDLLHQVVGRYGHQMALRLLYIYHFRRAITPDEMTEHMSALSEVLDFSTFVESTAASTGRQNRRQGGELSLSYLECLLAPELVSHVLQDRISAKTPNAASAAEGSISADQQ